MGLPIAVGGEDSAVVIVNETLPMDGLLSCRQTGKRDSFSNTLYELTANFSSGTEGKEKSPASLL